MVVDVVDLNQRRVEQATESRKITPVMILRETLRQIEAGEYSPESVMVIGITVDDDHDYIDIHHGGPASNNERIGMAFRAQLMMTGN